MHRFICIACLLLILSSSVSSQSFQAPFDTSGTMGSTDTAVTIDEVLNRVRSRNPVFRELPYLENAADAERRQAGIIANPELELEVEEVGWDAPGFDRAEIIAVVSQELEIFGQRGARVALAEARRRTVLLEGQLAAFDMYLEAKSRFYRLSHAQEEVGLRSESVELAQSTLDDIVSRIEKGAALQAELMLARLDLQRALLDLAEAEERQRTAGIFLSAMWGGDSEVLWVDDPDWAEGRRLYRSEAPDVPSADSARPLLLSRSRTDILQAQRALVNIEARPTVTFSAGLKRSRSERSNSLLFGLALPLPLWNSRAGEVDGVEARLRSLEYRMERQRQEVAAEVRATLEERRRLTRRLEMLDSGLLHSAEEAFAALSDAHSAGRVPFTSLLEAERALIELRLERNDIMLGLTEKAISLERLLGIDSTRQENEE